MYRNNQVKKLWRQRKNLILLLAALLLPCCAYISGMFVQRLIGASTNIFVCLRYGLFTGRGIFITLLLYVLTGVSLFLVSVRTGLINRVRYEDDRGVKLLEQGTYGTATWMEKKDINTVYQVGNIADITENVYGQLTQHGEQVVAHRNQIGGNRNVVVLGSPGSGKSHGFGRTSVIQAVRRGESVIVTDPSGELFDSLSEYCRNMGAVVKVFNLAHPEYSNAWNCIAETVDPETGRLNGLRMHEFTDIFMRNTSAGKDEDGFWYLAAVNLLNAMVGLCSWEYETDVITGYRHLLRQILMQNYPHEQDTETILSAISEEDTSLIELRNRILQYGCTAGFENDILLAYCDKVLEAARPFTMGAVLYRLITVMDDDQMRDLFSSLPLTHPAAIAFQTYINPGISDVVRASARQGVILRLQLFSDKSIRNITSNHDINFEEAGRILSAYFVITSDKSDAMKPLSSLFFSFVFKDLSDAWDVEQSRCQVSGELCRRLPVNVMCDEFYAIGLIPDFPVFISTCRKRKLFVTIILQSIGQLISLYGEDLGPTIQTCCDTVLFLGTNDLVTARFVSDFAGESTVMTQSHSDSDSLLRSSELTQLSISEGRRNLITPDEVLRTTNQVLLIRRGENLLKINRFGYTEHPAYVNGQMRNTSVFQYPSRDYSSKDFFRGSTVRDITAGRIMGNHKPISLLLRDLILPGCEQPSNVIEPVLEAVWEEDESEREKPKNGRRKRQWNIDL